MNCSEDTARPKIHLVVPRAGQTSRSWPERAVGNEASRTGAGNYMPFVLWFNFLSGFARLIAGAGLWTGQRWAAWLAIAIAAATAAAFAAFGVHVYGRGAYEVRTIVAMTLRTLVWAVIATVGLLVVLRPGE